MILYAEVKGLPTPSQLLSINMSDYSTKVVKCPMMTVKESNSQMVPWVKVSNRDLLVEAPSFLERWTN